MRSGRRCIARRAECMLVERRIAQRRHGSRGLREELEEALVEPVAGVAQLGGCTLMFLKLRCSSRNGLRKSVQVAPDSADRRMYTGGRFVFRPSRG